MSLCELYHALWGPGVGLTAGVSLDHWLAPLSPWTALPAGMWMTPERLSSLIWGSSLGRGGEAQGLKLCWGLVSVWMTTWVGVGHLGAPGAGGGGEGVPPSWRPLPSAVPRLSIRPHPTRHIPLSSLSRRNDLPEVSQLVLN